MSLTNLLHSLPEDQILTVRDLARVGLPPQSLGRAVDDGMLVRVRRGAYVTTRRWEAASHADRHLMLVAATVSRCGPAILSHESAAAVWGIPVLGPWPSRIQVSAPWHGGGRSSSGVDRHGAEPAVQPVERRGYLVTTPARTVTDLARSRSFAAGVVAADHALRSALCTRADLLGEAAGFGARPHAARARAVAAFADARAESPGESLSRARIAELGLQVPEIQVPVSSDRGRLLARVDFWWEEVRLVGEFDGRIKYRVGGIDDPRSVEDRVWAEKRREDEVRATGRRVVRWTWATARHRTALRDLLVEAGVPRAAP